MQKRRSRADRWWEARCRQGVNRPGGASERGNAGEAVQPSESRGHAKPSVPLRPAWLEAAPNGRSVCEAHAPTGEPDAGDPHVRFGEQGVVTDL